MSANRYRKEAFAGYSGVPTHLFSINRGDTQDSGYLTDLLQQHNALSDLPHSDLPHTYPTPQTVTSQSSSYFSDLSPNIPVENKPKPTSNHSSGRCKKNKIHKCTMCATDKRFTTKNDLERHMKTFHSLLKKGDKVWLCPEPECSSAGKWWPRFDNFSAHVLKQHGSLYSGKLEDSFEIVKEEQCGRNYKSMSKDRYARSHAKLSPNPSIDPRLCDGFSEISSEYDSISATIDHPGRTPRSSIITRHSPTASIASAARKFRSYAFRPSATASAKPIDDEIKSNRPKSPPSSASPRVFQTPPMIQVNSSMYSPMDPVFHDSPISAPIHVSPQQLPIATGTGDSQVSFITYYDIHVRDPLDAAPDTLAGIGSFDECPAPSPNTDTTLASAEHVDKLQECMDTYRLPNGDFQVIPDSYQQPRTCTRDPIPQLKVPPSLNSGIRFRSASSPGCIIETHNVPTHLLPGPAYPSGFSPETMLSSLSEGEKSFIYYFDTHDMDSKLDPATSSFIETFTTLVLELYRSLTPTSSNESTRPMTSGDQAPTPSARQRQTTNGSNNRKRKAKDLPDRNRQFNDDDDHEEQDNQNPNENPDNKRPCKGQGDFWACPYYKNDPSNHWQCSGVLIRSISVLKQHLKRIHTRPKIYCVRCSRKFETSEALAAHHREEIRCELVDDPYQDRMNRENQESIQRRSHGSATEIWYAIYDILFPDQPHPLSPFIDDQVTAMHIDNIFEALGPQAIQIMVQRRIRVHPATRALYDQAIGRYSERHPNYQLASAATQTIVPATQFPRTPDTMPSSYREDLTRQQFVGQSNVTNGFHYAAGQPQQHAIYPTAQPHMSNTGNNSAMNMYMQQQQRLQHQHQHQYQGQQAPQAVQANVADVNGWTTAFFANGRITTQDHMDDYVLFPESD